MDRLIENTRGRNRDEPDAFKLRWGFLGHDPRTWVMVGTEDMPEDLRIGEQDKADVWRIEKHRIVLLSSVAMIPHDVIVGFATTIGETRFDKSAHLWNGPMAAACEQAEWYARNWNWQLDAVGTAAKRHVRQRLGRRE